MSAQNNSGSQSNPSKATMSGQINSSLSNLLRKKSPEIRGQAQTPSVPSNMSANMARQFKSNNLSPKGNVLRNNPTLSLASVMANNAKTANMKHMTGKAS
jgi:hypothetical protein